MSRFHSDIIGWGVEGGVRAEQYHSLGNFSTVFPITREGTDQG